GGNALKFYATLRLEVKRIGAVKKGDEMVGSRTRIKTVKNKVAPPFRQIEVDIMYGRGVCRVGEVLEKAQQLGLLSKNGSWYSLGEERLGQGYETVREQLANDPAMLERVLRMVEASSGVAAAK
ncbi:MAG: DNA recombination/repair protein RecA, partial [Myxococcales bacterium]|nr:DNA recombination/repair protein RecA [Myxococcales bacterium]